MTTFLQTEFKWSIFFILVDANWVKNPLAIHNKYSKAIGFSVWLSIISVNKRRDNNC